MFSLAGKKALVTGGSRGIGRGIVLALAGQGAAVAVNFNSHPEEAEETTARVKALGRESFTVKADVSQPTAVVKMFEAVKSRWSGLDILVNNAGILSFAPFAQISDQQWDQVLAVNLKGQFLCAREAVKLMGKGGRIINIASIASGGVGVGFSALAHYSAAKGGVVGMTETMAIDLGPNINVNAIAPGVIESDMTKEILKDEKTVSGMLMRIPKKRVGQPADIGAAAAFLASDEADYITGSVLYVDGGWTAN